jgi:RNA polymerase sigma-70 factor (ECF subfamily)
MYRELIRQIQNGDRDAMARLVELDQAPLHHFMSRRLGNAEDAADATQEAFRRVLTSISRLRDPATYRGWLYRIALHVARDTVRSHQSERNLVRKVAHTMARSRSEDKPDPDPLDLREQVRGAVNHLEEDLRTTIVLRYEEGLSYDEIAEAMQAPAGTVAKRLHTAHERLQHLLAGAGAALALGSFTEALGEASTRPLPQTLADALKRVALESPLPQPVFPLASGAKILAAIFLIALGGGLVIWKARGPHPEASSGSARLPGAREDEAMPQKPGRLLPSKEKAPAGPIPASSFASSGELASFRGIVRDRETELPIPGAKVWLDHPRQSPPPRFWAVTGPDGGFLVEAPAGTYFIDVLAPGYVRFNMERIVHIHGLDVVLEKAQADQAGASLEVRLEPGRTQTRSIGLLPCGELRGLVVDSRGNPVPEAEVSLETQEFRFSSRPKEYHLVMTYEPDGQTLQYLTDFRGAFRIGHLHPGGGLCNVRVTHKGFAALRQTISLSSPPGETRLVLQDGMKLGGKVLNQQGEAVGNACLLMGVSGSDQLMSFPVRSTPEGTYLLTDLAPEGRFVAAYAPGYGPALALIEGNDPDQVHLVLPRADQRVSGIVLDESGQALEGVSAWVHHYDLHAGNAQARIGFVDEHGSGSTSNEPGRPSGFLPQFCRPPQSTSQADGRFDLGQIALTSGLCAGLQFEKTGYELVERTASESGFLEIRMRRKGEK